MPNSLNYRHLYYFWVVAKEGGFARAAERLEMAVQTVSAQVRELEKWLGTQLIKPAGRGIALTAAGETAFARAEEVFRIGQRIAEDVRSAAGNAGLRFRVGLSDGLSKFAAHGLLAPLLTTPSLHLLCHEGEFEQLLAELALHRLDVVLAGQTAPANPALRLTSQRLAAAAVDWHGPAEWVDAAAQADFPACLARLPVLLPTAHAPLRVALDRWFEGQALRPNVVGEFEDSALLSVFAARGMGVFPASRLSADDLAMVRGLQRLGGSDTVCEEVHAIHSHRGQHHPLVQRLLVPG